MRQQREHSTKRVWLTCAVIALTSGLFSGGGVSAADTINVRGNSTSSVASEHGLNVGTRADPLLAVDKNRNEIVARLMTQWSGEIPSAQRDALKSKVSGLRADRLLAASLVGSFDGVLELLVEQEKAGLPAGERSKALGDANRDLPYTPIAPCKLIDTRGLTGTPITGGAYAASERRSYAIPVGACPGLPTSGLAALLISAATSFGGSGGGILSLMNVAATAPVTNIFGSGYASVTTIVASGSAGQFDAQISGVAGAHLILDVVGYFAPPPQPIGDITEVNTGTSTTTGLTGGVTSGVAAVSLANPFKLPQSCATGQTPSYNSGTGLWSCSTPSTGTVTSVATGAGLTGGPISATGTIGLAATQLLPSTACAANQIAKWNGSAWSCAADDTGGSGTVTSVATGPGLTGGPISATGTIGLAATQLLPPAGCPFGSIPKSTGSAWVCAPDDTGPANAFVQGGNAFGAPAVIGTNDAQPLTVQSGDLTVKMLNSRGDGLRIEHRVGADITNAPATINGHRLNTVAASASGGTIAGGGYTNGLNTVTGGHGTIGGGANNSADYYGTISGGGQNTAGFQATVAGGTGNTASGSSSTVAGGSSNVASGAYSFAAGSFAQADKDGAFVWSDNSTFTPFKVTTNFAPGFGANSFNVRATGGVIFATKVDATTGAPSVSCFYAATYTGWNCTSDRNVKERIVPITPSRVLAGVLAMPVSTWSIIGSKFRQMGPMAQDFYRAFGLGDTDKAINSIDSSGVAFAAIQGLNQVVQKKDAEIAALKKRLAAIEKRLGIQ